MKNKLPILMLGMAAMLASCSQSDDLLQSEQTNTSDGLKAVTITATLPEDGMITRSVTADKDDEVNRCLLQILVYDENSDSYVPAKGDLAGVKTMIQNATKSSYKLNGIYLNANENYKFLFWADGQQWDDNTSGYNAADLMNVTLTNTNANPGIAWQGYATWGGQSTGSSVSANLTHAVAKVTLMTTTDLNADTPVSITIPTVYTAFDVNAGTVVQGATVTNKVYDTTTSAITATSDEPYEVFSFYALVAERLQYIVIANDRNSSNTGTTKFVEVPLGPNKHTTLQGDVRNLGLMDVSFTANIITGWGKPGTDPTGF